MTTYEEYLEQYKYKLWYSKIPETNKIIERIMPRKYEFDSGKRATYRVDNDYYSSFEEALKQNSPT